MIAAHGTKPGLVTHEDPAYNAEPPVHGLDAPLTPLSRLFVRNNGAIQDIDLAPERWRLTIDGEVERPFALTAAELERAFPIARVTSVLECAGNGRSLYADKTDGLPWGLGAVGCLAFEGVRLADILARAGVKPAAVYLGHESPDRTAAGKPALSRGLPIAKALAPETLVAFRVNGEPLPALHGGPLRIVAPGFPGSAWQKWLTRIWVRDREHDGARMTGLDYRLPRRPLRPGETPDPADFAVIEGMPPRALITSHAAGSTVAAGAKTLLGGWVWGHGRAVASVGFSLDGGRSWSDAALGPERDGPFAWRRFEARITTPMGPFTILARATLADGETQPLEAVWNPKGYCNNACQRLPLIGR